MSHSLERQRGRRQAEILLSLGSAFLSTAIEQEEGGEGVAAPGEAGTDKIGNSQRAV